MCSFLQLSNIPLCIYTTTYPFICQWTSRLLPCPSYCKQCCNEHCSTCVSFTFDFLGLYAQQWDCWVIWHFYSQFFKESPHCSPQWLYQLHSHQPCEEGSFFSPPSPAFIVCRFFDDGYSDWCQMIPRCGLICISLITSDGEHLFMCLLSICIV